MDLKTGKTYDSKDAAAADGVPDSDLIYLGEQFLKNGGYDPGTTEPQKGQPGEIVRPKNGPFKGRTYRRNALGQLELVSAPKQLHRALVRPR